MNNTPVYILIRTSRRPQGFKRCIESVKAQTYKGVVTIVHTDDPRDSYVTGDIILQGVKYPPNVGSATYNLYCNEMLAAIPDTKGWFMFLDDDDEFTAPDVLEKMVSQSKPDCLNVCRVRRWNGQIFPKNFGQKQSFQTECFLVSTEFKSCATWWSNKGGDHYYTKQLIQILPINWIDELIMVQCQNGKGRGVPEQNIIDDYCLNIIPVLATQPIKSGARRNWISQGHIRWIDYKTAVEYEKKGLAKITYFGKHKTQVFEKKIIF